MSATLGGQLVTSSNLIFPWTGVWSGSLECASDVLLGGVQTLEVGGLSITCSICHVASGVNNYTSRYTIVGGYGGWGTTVSAKGYHSDLGVKMREVLEDIGTACGERVVAATDARLDVDYLRREQTGSRCLTGLLGADWHVAANGLTICSPRSSTEISVSYELLRFDPIYRLSDLYVEDLSKLGVGAILRKTPTPQIIRSMRVETTSGAVHVRAESVPL